MFSEHCFLYALSALQRIDPLKFDCARCISQPSVNSRTEEISASSFCPTRISQLTSLTYFTNIYIYIYILLAMHIALRLPVEIYCTTSIKIPTPARIHFETCCLLLRFAVNT